MPCPVGGSSTILLMSQQASYRKLLAPPNGRMPTCSSSLGSTIHSGSSDSSCSIGWQHKSSNSSSLLHINGTNAFVSRACSHRKRQHLLPQHWQQQQGVIAQASTSGSAADNGSSSSSGSSSSGLLGVLQKWNQDTCKLREQLQSLGLAGVVAYGLFNTLYYTVAFLVAWFTVANVPAGLGHQAAMRKAAEVFALVWAGSQVTKLLRAGGALAFAPVLDKGLELAVQKFGLKSKQQAFALVVAACLALAAAVFGAVVATHM